MKALVEEAPRLTPTPPRPSKRASDGAPSVEVRDLRRHFGSLRVLDGIEREMPGLKAKVSRERTHQRPDMLPFEVKRDAMIVEVVSRAYREVRGIAQPLGALRLGLDGYAGRITTAGVVTSYTVPTSSSQPWGITAGPDGALWFTENNANEVGRLTTGGAFTEYPIPLKAGKIP